jgi:hypothetical protein
MTTDRGKRNHIRNKLKNRRRNRTKSERTWSKINSTKEKRERKKRMGQK